MVTQEKDDRLKSVSVMVVDDDTEIGKIAEYVLRDMGVGRTRRFENGGSALEEYCALSDEYDIIVCDWMMPGMSGLEVLKGVRAISKDIPFIMLTSKVTQESVMAAKRAGVTAYVRKPFTAGDLQKKMNTVITQMIDGMVGA